MTSAVFLLKNREEVSKSIYLAFFYFLFRIGQIRLTNYQPISITQTCSSLSSVEQNLFFRFQVEREFDFIIQIKLEFDQMEKGKYRSELGNYLILADIRLQRIITFQKKCMVNRTMEIKVTLLLNLISIFHTGFGYIVLENHPLSRDLQLFVQSLRNWAAFIYFSTIFIYFLNIVLVVVIYLMSIKQKEEFATQFAKFCVRNFLYLIKVNLFLTGFMLYVDLVPSLAAMAMASILFLFKVLVLGNYVNKKDQNYQSSSQLSLVFHCGLVLNLIINPILVFLNNLQLFYIWSILHGALLVIWFLLGGYKLFIHQLGCVIVRLFVASNMAMNIEFLVLLLNSANVSYFSFVEWTIALLITFVYLSIYSSSQQPNFKQIQVQELPTKIKQLELTLYKILHNTDANQDLQILVLGALRNHESIGCQNVSCELKKWRESFQEVEQTTYVLQGDECIRYFLKCAYEKALKSNKTKQLIISYCEFMISEFSNLSTDLLFVNQLLNQHSLSLFEKMKVMKMKLMIQQKSQAFNKSIFDGKVQLLEVMSSEQDFDFIMTKLVIFCKENNQLWKQLSNKTINATQIKDSIRKNVVLLSLIGKRWKKLNKFLAYKKQWKYFYLLYFLYLKNQKIKYKHTKFQSEFFSQQLKPTENLANFKKINTSLLFDNESALMIAYFNKEELVFYKISKSFSRLTMYAQSEIKNAPLNVILPLQLAPVHDQKALKALKNGNLTYEEQYGVKITHFRNKNQQKIDCITVFKLYIDFQSYNQCCKFVAYIRRNTRQAEPITNNIAKFHYRSSVFSCLQEQQINQNAFLSLNNTKNLFLKEESLYPQQQNSQLMRIEWILRFYSFLLLILLTVLCTVLRNESNNAAQKTNSWNIILSLYSYPMSLMTDYLRIILNIGESFAIKRLLTLTTENFMQQEQNIQTTRLIFDQLGSGYEKYAPYQINSVNQGISYDKIDIFQLITGCILSLSSMQNVDMQSHELIQLNSYLMPAYDTIMNDTKMQAHEELVNQLSDSISHQKIVLIMLILLFGLFALLLYYDLHKYLGDMQQTIRIIINFDTIHIRDIRSYWSKIAKGFNNLHNKFSEAKENLFTDYQLKLKQYLQAESKPQNNSSSKLGIIDKAESRKILIIRLIIGVCLFLEMAMGVALTATNIQSLRELQSFEDVGFSFFKYYPAGTIVGYALTSKYYSLTNPQSKFFDQTRFQSTIENTKAIGSTSYLSHYDTDSLFYAKMKNYMFANPCSFDDCALNKTNISLDFCLNYQNKIFNEGIFSYFRQMSPKVESYLSGDLNLSTTEIDDIINGFLLAGYYIDEVMQTWTEEFSNKFSSLVDGNIAMLVIIGTVVVVIHISVFQFWLMAQLKEDYGLMKSVFNYLVPQHILVNDKIKKHEFYECGILQSP